MRADHNASKLRTIKLKAMVGKELVLNIPSEDSARDPEDLTGMTAYGFIYDESDSYILNLSPTVGGADGLYKIRVTITSGLTPGWYRWEGGFIDSAGDQEIRFKGPIYLGSY